MRRLRIGCEGVCLAATHTKGHEISYRFTLSFYFAGLWSHRTSLADNSIAIMNFQQILICLAMATLCSTCLGCSVTSVDITKAAAAFKPSDSSAYTVTDVNEHIKHMLPTKFLSNTASTYSCVDARGDELHLSTPGWVSCRLTLQPGRGVSAQLPVWTLEFSYLSFCALHVAHLHECENLFDELHPAPGLDCLQR